MSDSALPPQVVLYQLAIGHYVTQALDVVTTLDVAEHLKDGPRSVEALAADTKTHAPSLRRVLRLLASVGVFEDREDGSFALTPIGETLRPGVPGSARAMVRLFSGPRIREAWNELEYCVRTGNPAYRLRGIDDPFKDPRRTPEDDANFDAAMADFTKLTAIAVAAAYDFSGIKTVVDVGGGNGALLIGVLQAHGHLRGTVFDQPAAAERARQQIAAAGLAERCDAVGGDFFREVPRGADAYLLKHVIHDWDDERAVAILANCRKAMGSRGTLLLIEGVYPARVDRSLDARAAAANDVNMLVCTGGRQRAEAEFRVLYEQAGFRLSRIIPTPARASLIEGRPV